MTHDRYREATQTRQDAEDECRDLQRFLQRSSDEFWSGLDDTIRRGFQEATGHASRLFTKQVASWSMCGMGTAENPTSAPGPLFPPTTGTAGDDQNSKFCPIAQTHVGIEGSCMHVIQVPRLKTSQSCGMN